MPDEVVDLDDGGVVDLGEEAPLGHGCGHRVGVTRVEQALEHHRPVVHRPVERQVDPAEAAVGEAAEHVVLSADEGARGELRDEGEPGSVLREITLYQMRVETWPSG